MWSRDGRRWLDSCGRFVCARTVRVLTNEAVESVGDAVNGGELADAFEVGLGQFISTAMEGNGVNISGM